MDALLFVACVAGASFWLLPAATPKVMVRPGVRVIGAQQLMRAMRRGVR